MTVTERDLVALVADKDMHATLAGILEQPARLRIRPITHDIFVDHEKHDPGCLRNGAEFLRRYARQYAHAIVMFDRDGCGRERCCREEIEALVESELSSHGWADRATAVVIDPELEAWVWNGSPNVDAALGWQGKQPDLRTWLRQQGLLTEGCAKPHDPKKAVKMALYRAKIPHSSAIFSKIASKVGFDACVDPAFNKLRQTLQRWFSREAT